MSYITNIQYFTHYPCSLILLCYLQLLYYDVKWLRMSIVKLLNTFTKLIKEISYMLYVLHVNV